MSGRVLPIVLLTALCGCGGSADDAAPTPVPLQETAAPSPQATAVPLPAWPQGRCRVDTSDPGWRVFVDGYPVRTAEGDILETPCLIEATAGVHSITVARDGRVDLTRQVLFDEDAEIAFDTASAAEGVSTLLTAPFLGMRVGEPQRLDTVNSPQGDFDPFVTADGRSLWFASDRSAGKGIYVATRPTPLHPFEAPTLLRLTSSIDQAASPSVNGEQTAIVYALPGKGRIRALTRSTPLSDFTDREVLLADDSPDARYLSVQILAAGDRLYFTREVQGALETRVALRQTKPGEPFGRVGIVEFPGSHPRLSADGLRQYVFDGKTLSRARRAGVSGRFGPLEKLIDLSLPDYRVSLERRQFWISEDEQWMFYADAPTASGTADLWMVRLSQGPAWGLPVQGKSVEPRRLAAAQLEPAIEPEPAMKAKEPEPEPAVDPRSLPLPYAAFREQFLAVTSQRDFDAALELVETAQADAALSDVSKFLEWDRQDVQQLQQFREDLEQALQRLQPGAKLRFGAVPVEFQSYANGVITAKARTKSIDKPVSELDPATLISLVETSIDFDDPEQALRAAVFLTYSGDGTSSRHASLLRVSGEAGEAFRNRLAEREAELARQEFARENIPAGLARLQTLEEQHAGTPAAAQAAAIRTALYERIEWKQTGGRNWSRGLDGEYTAGPERVEGALLVSPEEYDAFQLTMEYRTNERSGQGGVYFLYPGSGRPDRALKIQLSSDAGVNPDMYSTGALFGLDAPRINAAQRDGVWTRFEMSVAAGRVRVAINGQQTLDASFPTADRPTAGHVALDGVSGGISYRRMVLSRQPSLD